MIYKTNVITDKDRTRKNYVRLTEGTFNIVNINYPSTTENMLAPHQAKGAKHIWKLKGNKEYYKISWSIISSESAYGNISKRCNLCLAEKLYIIKGYKASNLNKRAQLISKCRNENKYILMNIVLRLKYIH